MEGEYLETPLVPLDASTEYPERPFNECPTSEAPSFTVYTPVDSSDEYQAGAGSPKKLLNPQSVPESGIIMHGDVVSLDGGSHHVSVPKIIADEEKKFLRLEDKVQAQKKLIAEYDNKLEHYRASIQALQAKARQQASELERLKATIQSRDADLQAFRRNNTYLKQVLTKTNQALEDARTDQEEKANIVRELQENAFRLIDSGQWMPEPDKDMKHRLSAVYKKIRKWSRAYATEDLSIFLRRRGENEDTLHKFFEHITKRHTTYILQDFEDSKLASKAPALLLTASASYFMCKNILERSFFSLMSLRNVEYGQKKEQTDRCSKGEILEEELDSLIQQISEYDLAGAQGLRCQMLRLLDPPLHRGQPNQDIINKMKENLSAARRTSCGQLTRDLFNMRSFQSLLKDPNSKAAEDDLQKIFISTAELAFKLWTQKRILTCYYATDLPFVFSQDSDLMSPHSLHNERVDEDAAALDDHPVSIVTYPAIIMRGNSQGENYDTVETVLQRAIVLVGSRKLASQRKNST